MSTESGKERSQRIQIDYYRRRDGLAVWRTACLSIGCIAALLYTAFLLASLNSGSNVVVKQLSTGPLATPHAHFENRCNECHQDFMPISTDATTINFNPAGVTPEKSVSRIESACNVCHPSTGHHRNAMTADWRSKDQNCVVCHSDHLGRSNDLTAVSNAKCAVCHADLNQTGTKNSLVHSKITGFTEGTHGDFRSLQSKDGGRVFFDHWQHLRPGQVERGQRGAFAINQLAAEDRPRYRKEGADGRLQTDTDLVQLACSDCHQLAGNPDSKQTLVADSELGRYFRPINFDQHCSACHGIVPGMSSKQSMPLPHAAPWSKIDLLIAGNIAGARSLGQARVPGDDTQTIPQPGVGLGRRAPTSVDSTVESELANARGLVQQQCKKCHFTEDYSDQSIREALAGRSASLIPARWLRHGLYDHAAHLSIDCEYCHSQIYQDDGRPEPTDHLQLMISGIETCVGCHRDSSMPESPEIAAKSKTVFGGLPTWGSNECRMCHRYHGANALNSPTLDEVRE